MRRISTLLLLFLLLPTLVFAFNVGRFSVDTGSGATRSTDLSDSSDLVRTANVGSAAMKNTGTSIGDVPIYQDDGSGNPVLPVGPVIDASGFDGNLAPTDTDIQKFAQKFNDFVAPAGGALSITQTATTPDQTTLSDGDIVVATTSQTVSLKTADGVLVLSGVYTVDPVTYSLTVDMVDGNGTDKVTVDGTDYTADATITGLAAGDYTVTATPDTGREATIVGDGYAGGTLTVDGDESLSVTFADVAAGTDPEYYWPLDDNAASNVVAASTGAYDAVAPANTDTLQTGSGLDLPTGTKLYAGSVGALIESGSWTYQATFTSVSADPPNGSNVYLFNVGLNFDLRLNFGATDNVTLYANGASQGNAASGYNFDDDLPHVVRLVYDRAAATIALYIGATEGALALHHTWTSVPAIASLGDYQNVGDNWNGVVSEWKIWASAVTP